MLPHLTSKQLSGVHKNFTQIHKCIGKSTEHVLACCWNVPGLKSEIFMKFKTLTI